MLVWPIMVVIRNRSDAAIAIRLSVQRFSKKHHILPKKRGRLARFSCATMRGQNMATFEAYCMKCKNTVTVKSPRKIVMSNGRTRVSGLCSRENCDGKLSKIIS